MPPNAPDAPLDLQALAYQITSPPRPGGEISLERNREITPNPPENPSNNIPEPPIDPKISQLEEQLQSQKLEFLQYQIGQAARSCQARDPELVELLLERSGQEDLEAAVAALRSARPWLFLDNGHRPRFAAATQGQAQAAEEEAVERRYRNNPWYRKR